MESTYQLSLPDYPKWVRASANFIAGITIICSIVASVALQDIKPLLLGFLAAFLPVYFHKRSGSPLPSKLEIQSNTLIAYDYPELDFNITHSSINILPEFSFNLEQSNFEWIDGWLFLNQQTSGASLKLCQDADPEKLTKWLQTNGFQVIGG